MAKKLELINGIPRMVEESSSPSIYDETILVVSSGATGPNELDGPVDAGTAITLPNGGTYDSNELEVRLSGQRLEDVVDYNYVGAGTRTQISLTFDLEVGDRLRFRVDRGA